MEKINLNMNEKTVSKLGLAIGTIGIVGSIVSAICNKKKTKKLEKDMEKLARHQSELFIYQEAINSDFEERLDQQEDEIITTMEHFQYLVEKI